jgi:DNA topoisomerase-1
MKLFVVESPTKVSKIAGFLGGEFKVIATRGHLYELPKKTLGVNTQTFEPEYIPIPKQRQTIDTIRKLAAKANEVWIGTDPDREGEAIGFHVASLVKDKRKIHRAIFHSITKGEIQRSVQTPGRMDDKLFEAAKTRRTLDRLIGFKLSPIAWRKVGAGTSIGRCQTPSLCLVSQHNTEVDSQTYQKISTGTSILKFEGIPDLTLTTEFDTIPSPQVKKDTRFTMISSTEKAFREPPPKPYITSTIQQQMNRERGWSPKKTMNVLQSLFMKGKITYIRTDSYALDASFSESVRDLLKSKFKGYQTRRRVANAQEGHEAIRPTKVNTRTVDGSHDEQTLYRKIWVSAVCCHMYPAIGVQQLYTAEDSEKVVWKGGHKVYSEFGWRVVGGRDGCSQERVDYNFRDHPFHTMTLTEKPKTVKHMWKLADLLKKMADVGIGRPSTYSTICDSIIDKGYLDVGDYTHKVTKKSIGIDENRYISIGDEEEIVDRRCLLLTDLGKKVRDISLQNMQMLLNTEYTSHMEEQLDQIAKGELEKEKVCGDVMKKLGGIAKICATLPKAQKKVKRNLHTEKYVYTFGKSKFGYYCCRQDIETGEKKYESVSRSFEDKATLEELGQMFVYPMNIETEVADFQVKKGKFGVYISYDGKNYKFRPKNKKKAPQMTAEDWEEWARFNLIIQDD